MTVNNHIHKNNLNTLTLVKDGDSVVFNGDDETFTIDNRLMRNMRPSESVNRITNAIKIAFFHYIILITLPDMNFIESTNSVVLNDLSNNEFRNNVINYLELAVDGLIKLINYYRNYKIVGYHKLIDLKDNVDNELNNIREEYGINARMKFNHYDLEEKIELYSDPEEDDKNKVSSSSIDTLDKQLYENADHITNDENGSDYEFPVYEDIVNEKIKRRNEINDVNIVIEQPVKEQVFLNNAFIDEYELSEVNTQNNFNPNNIKSNINENTNNNNDDNDKQKRGLFTVPVFCSLHTAWTSVKNWTLRGCNYLKTKIVNGARKIYNFFN